MLGGLQNVSINRLYCSLLHQPSRSLGGTYALATATATRAYLTVYCTALVARKRAISRQRLLGRSGINVPAQDKFSSQRDEYAGLGVAFLSVTRTDY